MAVAPQSQPEKALYTLRAQSEGVAYLEPLEDGNAAVIPSEWLPILAESGDVLEVTRLLKQGATTTTFGARVEVVR